MLVYLIICSLSHLASPHLDVKIRHLPRVGTDVRPAPPYTPVFDTDENIEVAVRHPSILISRVRLPLVLTLYKTMLGQKSVGWIGGRTFAGHKKCRVLVGVGPATMAFVTPLL